MGVVPTAPPAFPGNSQERRGQAGGLLSTDESSRVANDGLPAWN